MGICGECGATVQWLDCAKCEGTGYADPQPGDQERAPAAYEASLGERELCVICEGKGYTGPVCPTCGPGQFVPWELQLTADALARRLNGKSGEE